MRDEPNVELRRLTNHLVEYFEGSNFLQTVGRWSWKSKSSKQCVITDLPRKDALKMDGNKVIGLYSTAHSLRFSKESSV